MVQLIADSGSTKCEWCLINNGKKKTILTQGISPYFLDTNQIIELLQKELLPKLKNVEIANIYFYGTGLSNVNNVKIVNAALKKLFKGAKIEINHDLLAAARALCGNKKGIACILGTGSNSCFFNGKKIVKNSPGLGYVLGDEGSGAYLGKKVLQYYLYQTFDEDLLSRFEKQFNTNKTEILDAVYKKPLTNRYLATFNNFLVDNRVLYG
jgi:N-acetylglucosamine kinase-like BadF-type ATPase